MNNNSRSESELLKRFAQEEKAYEPIEKNMFELIGRLSFTFNVIDERFMEAFDTIKAKLPEGSELHRVKRHAAFSYKCELLERFGPWFLESKGENTGVGELNELIKNAKELSVRRNELIHSTVVQAWDTEEIPGREEPPFNIIRYAGLAMVGKDADKAKIVDSDFIVELRELNGKAVRLLVGFNVHWQTYFGIV